MPLPPVHSSHGHEYLAFCCNLGQLKGQHRKRYHPQTMVSLRRQVLGLAGGSSCAFAALCGKQALGSLGLLSSASFSLWVGIHRGDKTFSLATCPLEGSLTLWIQHLCLSVCGGGKALVLSCCAACRLPVWKPRFQVLGASCDHFLRWLVVGVSLMGFRITEAYLRMFPERLN